MADAALITQLQRTSPQTYNAATDLVVNGNLTLGGGESTFNFRSLYVTGNLTLNGNTHTNATALYVGGNFTISGPSGTSQFGPIYVGGIVNWGGALTVKTTDYTDSAKEPAAMYVGGNFTSAGGPFSHVFGPTYIQGAVTFSGNNAQILCPLLVSPGQITTSGSGGFGTVDDPMVLLGINDGTSATRAIQLSANAVFTGLVINMDGIVNLDNSGDGTFFIRGAVMSTGDVRFTNNGNVGLRPPGARQPRNSRPRRPRRTSFRGRGRSSRRTDPRALSLPPEQASCEGPRAPGGRQNRPAPSCIRVARPDNGTGAANPARSTFVTACEVAQWSSGHVRGNKGGKAAVREGGPAGRANLVARSPDGATGWV